jgi:voltage-gated potassium channel
MAMARTTTLLRLAGAQKGTITARGAAFAIATVTVLITVTSGVAMRWIDNDDFSSVWDGMWWAVQTVTTVGYGDAVPTTGAGRALATLVMLTAIGFIAVVTAAITAAFIESARKRLEEEEGAFVDPSTATLVAEVKEIASRIDRLDAKLDQLSDR